MNIFKKEENPKYASTVRRGSATMIDLWIVLILRITAMQILGALWLNPILARFFEEFSAAFGTVEVKSTPEHFNFVKNHEIFINAILFYFIIIMIGAVYHAYLNSSKWQATIGKRVMKTMITTGSDMKISLLRGFCHYFLSLAPFIYISYITFYQQAHQITMSQAIANSELNLILGIIFVLWIQIQAFSPRKTTAYDLICNTISVNGKTAYKWPWSKQPEQTTEVK